MSGQSVLDSIPRTFDRTSYQPTPLEMDATINSAFDALDDIQFDLQPFTVQGTLRKDSSTLERRRFSWETLSTSSYHAISDNTFGSDAKSQLYIFDITGTFPNNYDSLDQRVHRWLSELPDIPWLHALYDTTEDESSSPVDTERSRESIPGTPGLLNYLDFLDTCYEGIEPTSPTRGYVDYGRPELYDTTDPTTSLDAYHLTLLQIDTSSPFATEADRKFRPSMRRRYPRGLEKEARKSISVVASSRSHE
ncbi:hypothetical protein FPRO06_12169 [Fusarium proliferatum]|nr:hypothetical protein FPRO06_12169 [Fusarium proliferatum]